MISLFILIIYLFILLGCCYLAILSLVRAINKRTQARSILYFISALAFTIAAYFLWKIDVLGTETTDREEASQAFRENFGFAPPNGVKEIKVKNFVLYDASAHWMAFTYDSTVLNKILKHDQPLNISTFGTKEYRQVADSLKKGCANCPGWLILPNSYTPKIYSKRNFLQHNYSTYNLWIDTAQKMVYLEVSYFD